MNEDYKAIWFAILKRLVPAVAAMAAGVWILLRAGDVGSMLLGFLFFLVAATAIAGPVARLLAEPTGGLLWPRRYYDKPQPIYSIPQSKRIKGEPEEAIAGFAKIAAEHPDEIRPYLEMIDIALTDLRDPDRANAIYQHGISALKKPEARDHLARVYADTRERMAPAPTRHIPMPRRAPDAP